MVRAFGCCRRRHETRGSRMLAYEWTFGSFLWGMLVFFFWVSLLWMFIAAVVDVFRRRDLSGWAKAGWLVVLFILPLIGVLIYLIARPSTADDDAWGYGAPSAYRGSVSPATAGLNGSVADELSKLAKLHADGDLDDAQ